MSYDSERLNELLGQCQAASRKLLDLADEADHLMYVRKLDAGIGTALRDGLRRAADSVTEADQGLLHRCAEAPRSHADQHAWSMGFDGKPLTDEEGTPWCPEHRGFCGHGIPDPLLEIERNLP